MRRWVILSKFHIFCFSMHAIKRCIRYTLSVLQMWTSALSKTSVASEASAWTCQAPTSVNVTAASGASPTAIPPVKVQTRRCWRQCSGVLLTKHCVNKTGSLLMWLILPLGSETFFTASRHKWVFKSRHLSQWAMWEHPRLVRVRPMFAWSWGPGRHLLWWVQLCS